MDAQEITFNQDPEAAATDVAEDTKDRNCCCKLMCCPCNLVYWYLAPLTCEFCYTLKCWLYHPLNFALAIFFVVWDCTMLSVGIGLIACCCMGIPLLWISIETIVLFSRLDLGMNYYMVEDGKRLDKEKKHLLTLSLYNTDVPLCCCYNNGYDNCLNLMWERMKYLFTTFQVYKYILYQVFIRSTLTFITWWIMIAVAVNVALLGFPIWYLVDDTQFKRNQVTLSWRKDCQWIEVDNADGEYMYDTIQCDKDYAFIINTLQRAVGVTVVSLLILPLTMRVNNWFACLNKVVAYRFYTFYYNSSDADIQDRSPMLTNNVKIDSVEEV